MLTKRQYQILNTCADDWELFYYPFAEVNYGGQIFRRTDPTEEIAKRLGFEARLPPGRYEDEGSWHISVSGLEIAYDIRVLVGLGFLRVQRVDASRKRRAVGPEGLTKEELLAYRDYECLTFDDHLEKLGYGPHEFALTELGLTEIDRPEYRQYDLELGWI
ncbi:MAG: hypothetical protein ACREBU_23615 [Nitrososphaera sp.]